jgi:hypothetical protein
MWRLVICRSARRVARAALVVLVAAALVSPRASGQAVSEPAILQMFEARLGHDRGPHGGYF